MDVDADEYGGVAVAIELAAREAVRRQVDLRLVYGQVDLPPLALTCQILEDLVTRATDAYPSLAITTAIFPGTATAALITASATASLIVTTAQTYLDNSDAIGELTTGAMFNAPIVMVTEPATIAEHRNQRDEEPALTF